MPRASRADGSLPPANLTLPQLLDWWDRQCQGRLQNAKCCSHCGRFQLGPCKGWGSMPPIDEHPPPYGLANPSLLPHVVSGRMWQLCPCCRASPAAR